MNAPVYIPAGVLQRIFSQNFAWLSLVCLILQPGVPCVADSPELKPLSDILPGNYHQSGYYRINDLSINNNNYVFTVESEYGRFRVESVGLALKYLRETQIVSQVLNQIPSRSDSQEVDLQSQLRIRAESAIDILSSPLGTAGNLAGQLARNLGDTFAGNSPYVIYESEYEGSNRMDPNLEIHKRNIASQLGLDVYSSNDIVQHMLIQLARERSAGNISSGSVLVNVNNNFEIKIASGQVDGEINTIIRKYPVDVLYTHNASLLEDLGISEGIRKNFLMHQSYSPSLQTTVIKYLEHLYFIDNPDEFLGLSLLATDEVTANSFARVLRIFAWYNENYDKLKAFKLVGNQITVLSETDELIVVYPHDVFLLNEDTEALINTLVERATINDYSGIRIVAYGSITDAAKSELLDKGIDYSENVLFL